MSFEWHKINIGLIIGGIAPDGFPYLKYFLIDYKQEFSVEKVNPNCQKCLVDYHNQFIKKYGDMENTSNYRLHKKREGLQLAFGSSIFVNNKNITDDYAEKLIQKFSSLNPDFKLDDLFDKFPDQKKEIEKIHQIKPRKKRK